LNYAVLDYAARNSDHLLYNIYLMGKTSIQSGSEDHFTLTPSRINAVSSAYEKDRKSKKPGDSINNKSRGNQGTLPLKYYDILFKDQAQRDPRGYIIPAGQADFPTAVKFINALIRSGISVYRATATFMTEGISYPAGSYIIKTSQAFRPHILDMFEPQDYPNDFLYPGGPPVPPYDITGWTPALTMGFKFTRVLNAFDGPFEVIPYGEIQSPPGDFKLESYATGYILDSRCDNSFTAVNDLISSGFAVYRIKNSSVMTEIGQGSFFIPSSQKAKSILEKAAVRLSLHILPVMKNPSGLSAKLSTVRVAIWDMYGGSISSGWLKWIMEQHNFRFNTIYSREINAGDLKKKYDVIIFVSGAIPELSGSEQPASRDTTKMSDIPVEYRSRWGKISADTSITAIKKFMEAGGTVITIGKSTSLAYHLKLDVSDALVEINKGIPAPLPSEKFYIPGSILRVSVDTTLTSCWGMESSADVIFDSSPVFRIKPEAMSQMKIKPIAWFSSEKPLRSGWAWGQQYLKDGVAAFETKVGTGKLYAFGPEITFRSQTYSTFKLIFNQLYSGY
jgi:hypothetical protein